MAVTSSSSAPTALLDRDGLDTLITTLSSDGYQVIGPRRRDDAIVYDHLERTADLPVGWDDQQEGGRYRLVNSDRPALFDYVVGPHSWKRFLFPPVQTLWRAQRRGKGFLVSDEVPATPRYAFLGVRSCELHAIQVQDRVFGSGPYTDPGYLARRHAAFIVAVNCAKPAATCFCGSLQTGPKALWGFDLALTELLDDQRHVFLIEAGSEAGAALLARLPKQPADDAAIAAAAAQAEAASASLQRELVADAGTAIQQNPEHRRWDEVAKRCLNCANCTLVCPTCFCTTVEDVTDLGGQRAERRRQWDSCFTLDFSYIHGGHVRREGRSRYRQWLTHKLATWHDQFGVSGCVGCGRCITWCPVAIDITEEARAIRDSGGG